MAINNIMQRKAIPELLNKKYYIPEYQRGYRWEDKQVLNLLDDLDTFFSGDTKGQFYCLQPIVVKEVTIDNEKWLEVIDGQQRLTTILILMKVFDQLNAPKFGLPKTHSYTIRYATRPSIQNIFDTISITSEPSTNKAVIDESKNQWPGMIDSLYIYNAAKTILNWFMDEQPRIFRYGQYFYNTVNSGDKSVQVVWYETNEDKDPHDIFNRMNSLKVGLSCSELIRSIFLSSCTKFNLGTFDGLSDSLKLEVEKERFQQKQSSINEKWDEIEQQMRDESFQSFLTSRNIKSRNAIDLLFDLVSGKYASNKPFNSNLNKEDELYTYLYIKNMVDVDGDAWTTWLSILNVYEKLLFWYHDRDLYHRIGFLNTIAATGHEDDAVYTLLAERKGKIALRNKVVSMIKEAMILPENKETHQPIEKLSQLSYDNNIHYNYIKRLLILYNVETSRIQTSSEFFDFDKFRYTADKKHKIWTLEHIHAQNSDCLPETNKDSWYEWIVFNRDSLKKLVLGDPNLEKQRISLVDQLERDSAVNNEKQEPYCKSIKYTFENIKELFDDVANFYAQLDAKADKAKPMHQLSNMALLDLGQNAMVGKSPFEVKRQIISNQIADNKYYPICTQKVFLKLYDKDSMQIHSWSQRDRELYLEDMKQKLTEYLPNNSFIQ
ncbi:DUF262 domain-containing protein [Barnesiella intestinihominis]|uniref:DUF262 domain-containing protein n=1 Tax=Barnesiella intestinihominis TaxID=487174 RepID=UPI0039956E77